MIISDLESIKDTILIAHWKYLEKINCRNLNVFPQQSQANVKLKYLFIFILSQTKITNLKNQKQPLAGFLSIVVLETFKALKENSEWKFFLNKTAA